MMAPDAHQVEGIEAEAWAGMQLALAPAVRERWGVKVQRGHGGVMLIASRIPVLTLNRALALGFDVPLTESCLQQLMRTYETAGVSEMLIQWSPAATPAQAGDLFERYGFRLLSRMAKVWRDARAPIDAHVLPDAIDVVQIGPDEASTYERIVAKPLGVPAGFEAGITSTIGLRGWRHYLARRNGMPVAGAASYQDGQYAWFGLAATLECERGKGAQTALLSRRLADAASEGCRWATADTLAETPSRPNQSYRNMLRLGFNDLYSRPNYAGPSAPRGTE
jgi:hypothetical protein